MSYGTPEEVVEIIRNAAEHHFNIVVFQVRGNATAWYASELEPWAWELSGDDPSTLGTDPGWDPLALAVEEAHARGLELHAWVNVFPGWLRTVPPPEEADQLWNTHRDWFMQNEAGEVMWPQGWWDYWMSFLDPGVPEVKQHLHDVFMEIVTKYEVDGLHYDFVRYPSEVGDWAYNPISVARFKKHYKDYTDPSPAKYPVQWNEWKRNQITEIIQSVYRDAKAVRPNLLISAAVIHDWTRAHNDYAQDTRTWFSRGILDASLPMLYRYKPADFPYVARDHLNHAYGRWVLPGINAKRRTAEEMVELVRLSRSLGAPGVAVFGYRAMFPDHQPSGTAETLLHSVFAEKAAIPKRGWEQATGGEAGRAMAK
jgi:uncharacterized lipoprotein YddW (UPF0748 family)